MNLSYPGLEAVAAAASVGDLNTACETLAEYYRNSNTSFWLRLPPVTPGSGRVGKGSLVDNAVDYDIYYMAGVTTSAKIPRNADGGLDWLNKGPRDDVEFMNCLNRFDVIDWLLKAYSATGNPVYTTYFSATMEDWATHNPCPNALSKGQSCSPQGVNTYAPCAWGSADVPGKQACATGTFESPWRSLEMGIRTNGVFASGFFGFQRAAEFTTSSRVLMLLAQGEHNAALAVDGGHPGQGTPNWEMGQWSGLLTSTVNFPELWNASGLQMQSLNELEALFGSLVYPDGVETEMASGYDMWVARETFQVLQTLALVGHVLPPAAYSDRVEAMWNYGAYISDPMGCLPRNGDSDLCGGGFGQEQAEYFERPDWTWISSHGASGSPPELPNGPSSAFPWAGQLVMRSGFHENDTWVFFDVGPYGSSLHGHRDKLHVNLHARGSMLLVDSGRFAYAGTGLSNTLHTQYGPFTRAHNTLTIDDADQLPLPATVQEPIPSTSYNLSSISDWAFGSMSLWDDSLNGQATHTRGLFYFHGHASAWGPPTGDFLIVVDRLTSDRPRKLEATWHAHPNASLRILSPPSEPPFIALVGGADTFTGRPTQAQACVVSSGGPLSSAWASVEVVRGVMANGTQPYQAWYSQSYDDAWPAPTLVYRVESAPSGAVFAWLIVPSTTPTTCTDLTAEIVSSNSTSVSVKVSVAGVLQTLLVPMG